jgi:hypothetical protein
MLASIIAEAVQKIHRYFDPEETNRKAMQTGFVQRKSKLSGWIFLKLMVLGFLQYPQASLNQLSQVSLDLGIRITPQGIDERLNKSGVEFLQKRFTEALEQWQARCQKVAAVFAHFSEVYWQDSTIQSLPEGLQYEFPGVGGNASPAAVKIQLLFGFLKGNISFLELGCGRSADNHYQAHLPHLLPGCLLIQDLGYFSLQILQAIIDQGSFFLSRLKISVSIYRSQDDKQSLDILALAKQQTTEVATYKICMGEKQRLECRMLCVQIPQAVAAQRRRKLNADAKRRGTSLKKRTLDVCDWSFFVTNVAEEHLSPHQILAMYGFRWQIELIFKLWKSQAGLKHLRGIRRERVLCELYAKLIGLVLTHFLTAPLRFWQLDLHFEISLPKARQIIQDRAKNLARFAGVDLTGLYDEIMALTDRILIFAHKNKRKKHLSSLNHLILADQLSVAQLFPLA